MDALELRTLLATTPPATSLGNFSDLSGLASASKNGNANNPQVVIDPYDPQKLFAVWQLDEGSQPLIQNTTSLVEGAYSTDGGGSWTPLGIVAFPQLDPLTVDATPPKFYPQTIDPSVAFDGQNNVYVLTQQQSSATDGLVFLNEFNFSGGSPSQVQLSDNGYVFQWVRRHGRGGRSDFGRRSSTGVRHGASQRARQ